jgi:CspA family cold shock protein
VLPIGNNFTKDPFMDKYIGIVIWFNNKPGYGFIEWEKGGAKCADLFVHFSDIVCDSFKTLKKGQKVSFGIGENNKGQPKAIEVVVLEE